MVLDLDQLRREVAEVGVGLERRIVLLQQHEVLQPLAEIALVREALDDPGCRRDGRGAQLGDGGEQRLLVRRVGAHRLDQLRHEVGAALELHVDIGVALAREVAAGDQAVVEPDRGREHREPDHRRPDLQRHRVMSPLPGSLNQRQILGRSTGEDASDLGGVEPV